ncbi:MAG: peroxide stress protein YaaA [Rhodospirillaceae bacterium]
MPMLFALLSPAKKLDFSPPPNFAKETRPALMKDTAELAARAKKYSARQLQNLMGISTKLAELNFERFQAFDPGNKRGTKPAMFTFAGDVYQGLDAKTLDREDVAFAQKHIGMLSGLYGLLRPLDAIQPYRLEMGSAVKTARGGDLHTFWRESLTAHINKITSKMKDPVIVNLASNEYWSAVAEAQLRAPVIQCQFREIKDGKARVIGLLAKKARGMMARAIIDHRWTKPEQIKTFKAGGYQFDAKASSETTWIFSRKAK